LRTFPESFSGRRTEDYERDRKNKDKDKGKDKAVDEFLGKTIGNPE
jgi:hypothetical protein